MTTAWMMKSRYSRQVWAASNRRDHMTPVGRWLYRLIRRAIPWAFVPDRMHLLLERQNLLSDIYQLTNENAYLRQQLEEQRRQTS